MVRGGKFLTTLLLMRLCHGYLLVLSFFTIEETSPGVVGNADSAMGSNE